MKKIILAITTICILALACNKTKTDLKQETNLGIKNTRNTVTIQFNSIDYHIIDGILNFETFEKYENIVNSDKREELITFANSVYKSNGIKTYYDRVNEKEKDQFDFIGKLLNKDGFIKIDAYLILIDFENSLVYAQKNGNTNDITSTKNGRLVASVIKFSIMDDVIEELKINGTRGLFCNALWQGKFENFPQDGALQTSLSSVQYTPGGNVTLPVQINTSVKYWTAGIYFELNSRVVVTPAGNPLATAPFSYVTTYSCKRRCGNTFSGSNTRSFSNASNDKNVMYWNSRALTKGYTSISSTVSSSASVPAGATRTAIY